MEYEFTLKFKLPASEESTDRLLDRLGAEGCDDALVGVGQPGHIALDFTREARSASKAVLGAISDVQRAIPGSSLIEAGPDYVGLTDVAAMIGVSRQNMRKLAASHIDFPSPVHGGSAQVWHLESVLRWLAARGSYNVEKRLLEIARIAMECNVTKELNRLHPSDRRDMRKLLPA